MVAAHTDPGGALFKWRSQLHNTGGESLSKVRQAFTLVDADRSGRLDKRDFQRACNHAGVFLSSQETSVLFRSFPGDGGSEQKSGVPIYVDLHALFNAVSGELHPAGVERAELAWGLFAGDAAEVSVDRVVSSYDAGKHPRVAVHELSPEAVLDTLRSTLEELALVQGEEGRVSKTVFFRYVAELACCTPPGKPRFFEDIMSGFGGTAVEAVAPERLQQLVLFLVDKIRQYTPGRADGLRATVKKLFQMQDEGDKGGLTYVEFGMFLTSIGMELPDVEKQGLFKHIAGLGHSHGNWAMFDELARLVDELNAGTVNTVYVSGEPPASLVDKIRTHVLAKHPCGLQSLTLAFRHVDKERKQWVIHADFHAALRQCSLRLTPEDMTRLIAFFDPASLDKIEYGRFIAAIRGPISEHRLGYIQRAWDKVAGGAGEVPANALSSVYEPSMHPKVANNHQTPEAKVAEIILVAAETGVVTQHSFLEYFLDESSSIQQDCYFERYMDTAFGL